MWTSVVYSYFPPDFLDSKDNTDENAGWNKKSIFMWFNNPQMPKLSKYSIDTKQSYYLKQSVGAGLAMVDWSFFTSICIK